MTAKVEVFDELRLRWATGAAADSLRAAAVALLLGYQLIARGARVINQLEAYGMYCLNSAIGPCRNCVTPLTANSSCSGGALRALYCAEVFAREGLELRVSVCRSQLAGDL